MVQLKKTDVNAKIRKFENKTFSTSDLVKQAGYGAKFIEIEKKKYLVSGIITTSQFNRSAKFVFDEKIRKVTKTLQLRMT